VASNYVIPWIPFWFESRPSIVVYVSGRRNQLICNLLLKKANLARGWNQIIKHIYAH